MRDQTYSELLFSSILSLLCIVLYLLYRYSVSEAFLPLFLPLYLHPSLIHSSSLLCIVPYLLYTVPEASLSPSHRPSLRPLVNSS